MSSAHRCNSLPGCVGECYNNFLGCPVSRELLWNAAKNFNRHLDVDNSDPRFSVEVTSLPNGYRNVRNDLYETALDPETHEAKVFVRLNKLKEIVEKERKLQCPKCGENNQSNKKYCCECKSSGHFTGDFLNCQTLRMTYWDQLREMFIEDFDIDNEDPTIQFELFHVPSELRNIKNDLIANEWNDEGKYGQVTMHLNRLREMVENDEMDSFQCPQCGKTGHTFDCSNETKFCFLCEGNDHSTNDFSACEVLRVSLWRQVSEKTNPEDLTIRIFLPYLPIALRNVKNDLIETKWNKRKRLARVLVTLSKLREMVLNDEH